MHMRMRGMYLSEGHIWKPIRADYSLSVSGENPCRSAVTTEPTFCERNETPGMSIGKSRLI